MMVGHEVQLVVDKEPASPGEPVLEVTDLVVADDRRQPVVNGVSFDVRAGEILALAGVQGNGQSESSRPSAACAAPHGHPAAFGEDRAGPASPTCSAGPGARPRGPPALRAHRLDAGVVQPGPQPGEGRAFSPGPAAGPPGGAPPRGRPRRAVRRAHAVGRRRGRHPVGRQPAEGHHRPRVLPRRAPAGAVPAHPRARRRLHPVHPPPGRRQATRASLCCSTRPSSTRCWRWPTASR